MNYGGAVAQGTPALDETAASIARLFAVERLPGHPGVHASAKL